MALICTDDDLPSLINVDPYESDCEYFPPRNCFVRVEDDHRLKVSGIGKVQISNIKSEINSVIVLTNVLHVPPLSKCLISVSALDDKGCTLTFSDGKCKA